jgi:hypothetical protein
MRGQARRIGEAQRHIFEMRKAGKQLSERSLEEGSQHESTFTKVVLLLVPAAKFFSVV